MVQVARDLFFVPLASIYFMVFKFWSTLMFDKCIFWSTFEFENQVPCLNFGRCFRGFWNLERIKTSNGSKSQIPKNLKWIKNTKGDQILSKLKMYQSGSKIPKLSWVRTKPGSFPERSIGSLHLYRTLYAGIHGLWADQSIRISTGILVWFRIDRSVVP